MGRYILQLHLQDLIIIIIRSKVAYFPEIYRAIKYPKD